MPYTKLVLCLACSQKKPGFCVAGKEIIPGVGVGGWVRPVNAGAESAITKAQRIYPDGYSAVKLDVIRMSFDEEDHSCFQMENHLVNGDAQWRLERKHSVATLQNIIDRPIDLWLTGCEPTNYGRNDRVSQARLNQPTASLYLIQVSSLQTIVEIDPFTDKKKFRGEFLYNGTTYRLWIKDIQWQRKYANVDEGVYEEAIQYLTISLGLVHTDGYAYKLIAAIF